MITLTLKQRQAQPPVYLLVLLMSFASLAAVLITPALPMIGQDFHISSSGSTWLITLFLLGYAIGQLPYGPIANRFGRRKAALVGLALALVGSLLQLLAMAEHSFSLLLLARALSAFGGACGPVLAMTILSDCYDEAGARKMMATLILVFALMPCLAIALGGFLTTHCGWHSTLIIIAIYNIIVLALVYSQLGETLPNDQHKKIHPIHTIKGLLSVFLAPNYLLCILLFTAGTATSYLFNSLAPALAIDTLKASPQDFGLLSIITSVGLLIGSYLAGNLSHKYSGKNVLMFGVVLLLATSIIFILLFSANIINLYSLFMPAFFLFISAALIMPNASMLALSAVKDKASGAGSMNATNLLLTSILVSIGGHFSEHYLTALPIAFLILALASLAVLFNLKQIKIFNN
ncbi:MFS transporter [Piscirickettsia litoralis]|uniref:Major facilitator superfamily (MFS) profile domain-containing protein n=1 Tax=Piscirickettsia litoralis TaxID=1891921 RepID=A0ABX3A3D8_9GAMM|nr:MFS transporter [Piscirickettsia litoralis]ODN43382.1 hypothetical protein BGC07_11170 [Piscirickettsia litoralis]